MPRSLAAIWTINVASRVLTRKTATSHGGHVFQQTGIFFELVQDIIGMNLLTKFHENRTINVASRVKNAPPLGSHVFQAKVTIFELIQDISGTNLLSKFHEDRKINVASRVLTRKNAPLPGGHVFQPTGIVFKHVQDIIGMNLLTKFYEKQTINVASRVLTRFYYSYIRKNAPHLGSHVFQANVTIFELIQDIIETNLLIKFHEYWTINVASRELTRQMLTPHNGQHTTDRKRSQKLAMSTLNVASRVFTRNTALPTSGHTNILTNFELNRGIIGTNLQTKFHEDRTRNVASRVFTRKTAPPTGDHVFQQTGTTFELNQHIIKTNILTNFELDRGIIGTNLLTKFHEDRTRNVASRVFTNQMWTTDGQTTDKNRSQKLT
ncbi:hypothetical protein DPMN_036212 [Dreissena polymorpha]|uniref:Uncharacterized protein n=1 Tax=Dreissena polymorpha TaxID=45954 RepID=A0A9D4MAJ1_DREPO|nr:hypothetical protein DPMN_036212 [Dreissena polymorpha]